MNDKIQIGHAAYTPHPFSDKLPSNAIVGNGHWTNQTPTENGFYWFRKRQQNRGEPFVMRYTRQSMGRGEIGHPDGMRYSTTDDEKALGEFWSERILPPE